MQMKHGPLSIEVIIHKGFKCFFQKYAEQNDVTYRECYDELMKSCYRIHQIENPLKSILKLPTADKICEELKKRAYQGRKFVYHDAVQNQYYHFNEGEAEDKFMREIN